MFSKLKSNFITPEIGLRLKAKGITSLRHFLNESAFNLQKICSISMSDINLVKQEIIKILFPTKINAKDLLLQKKPDPEVFQTRIDELDELLEGGFQAGTINEFLGYGKSLLMYSIILNIMLNDAVDVIIIAFNHKYVSCSLRSILREREFPNDEIEDVLGKIKIESFSSATELHKLVKYLVDNSEIAKAHKIIVFESIGADFLLHFRKLNSKFNVLMIDILQTIRKIVFENNNLILMSNLIATKRNFTQTQDTNQSLIEITEKSWKSFMDNRFLLNTKFKCKIDAPFETEVKILKSRHLKTDNSCVLTGTTMGYV